MRRRDELIFWIALALTVLIFIRCARAEEPSCRRVGADVCCREPDFRLLTDKLIDLRAGLTKCQLALDDAQGRLRACIEDGKPLPPPVVTPPTPVAQSWRVDAGWLVAAAGAGFVAGAVVVLLAH